MSSRADTVIFDEGTDLCFGIWPNTPTVTQTGDEFGVSGSFLSKVAGTHAALLEESLDLVQQFLGFVCHDPNYIRFRGYCNCFL